MLGFNANEKGTGGLNNESNNSSKNQTNQKDMNNQKTKNKARIYNLIIIDESGSMTGLEHATTTGVNDIIDNIKKAQREFAATQEHYLTIVTFDSNGNRMPVRTLIERKHIDEITTFDNYAPYGATPLYDAMGQSITTLHNHIKDDDDATAVVTIVTDGYENASTEWNAASIKALIEQLKQEGWSFSYMGSDHDVKHVSELLSIECSIEFSHDVKGVKNTWMRDNSAKFNYYRKMDEEYRSGRRQSKEEWIKHKRQMAKDYYTNRVTPEQINYLQEAEIFVFGSNPQGLHSGGAARDAANHFGAVWGQGEGLQGQCYAIPTTCTTKEMNQAVRRFIHFAELHSELRFLVTRVGCGIAGHSVTDVAPMFADCIKLENVTLPADFWKVLGLKM